MLMQSIGTAKTVTPNRNSTGSAPWGRELGLCPPRSKALCIRLLPMFVLLLATNFSLSSSADASSILPVGAFAALPDTVDIKLSPGGNRMATLRRITVNELPGTAITIENLETRETFTPLYSNNDRYVIESINWANDRLLIFSIGFPDTRWGNRTVESRLLKLDAVTGEADNVFSATYLDRLGYLPQHQDRIIDLLPDDENHILLSQTTHDAAKQSVIKLNLETGYASTETLAVRDAVDWLTDREHRVRIVTRRDDDDFSIDHKGIEEGDEWTTLWSFKAFSQDYVRPLGFAADANKLYVVRKQAGKLAVYIVNLASGAALDQELVNTADVTDLSGRVAFSEKSERVIGIVNSNTGSLQFWDSEYRQIQQQIDRALPGKKNTFVGLSRDENRYVFLSANGRDAGTFYLGDRSSNTVNEVARKYENLPATDMAETRWFSYPVRGDQQARDLLTTPTTGDGPYPTIILPRAVSGNRDDSSFDLWTQFFANRGFAVLQMGFTGEARYSFRYWKMKEDAWGERSYSEIGDAAQALIDAGVSDATRICLVGSGYGGYVTLMEAAQNSGKYRCAVSFAGVTDLVSFVDASRRFSNYGLVRAQINNKRSSLKSFSPIALAEDIDVPVLLLHGSQDRLVRVEQSRRMHKALRRKRKNVRYVELEDGNHVLDAEDQRLELFNAMDQFLTTYLREPNNQAAVNP